MDLPGNFMQGYDSQPVSVNTSFWKRGNLSFENTKNKIFCSVSLICSGYMYIYSART